MGKGEVGGIAGLGGKVVGVVGVGRNFLLGRLLLPGSELRMELKS